MRKILLGLVLVLGLLGGVAPASAASTRLAGCVAQGYTIQIPSDWRVDNNCTPHMSAIQPAGRATLKVAVEPHAWWSDQRSRASITADILNKGTGRDVGPFTFGTITLGGHRFYTGYAVFDKPKNTGWLQYEAESFIAGHMYKLIGINRLVDKPTAKSDGYIIGYTFASIRFSADQSVAPPTGTQAAPASTSTPAAAAPTNTAVPTSTPAAAPLAVQVSVSPGSISYGGYPTVTIQTAPDAACDISVTYDTGRHPVSYPEHIATADANGTISESGQWHMESKGGGGIVNATCTLNGQSASGSASFSIG